MKTAIVTVALLALLGGCTTYPNRTAYAPVATSPTTTYMTPAYTAPATTYVYVPSTTYVPNTTYVAPSSTYVPSASPAYYTTMDECRRARGVWHSTTSSCDFRR
jgi:hypothetical protein